MSEKYDFVKFLKTHSSISNKFIDEFSSMYNMETTNKDHIVKLEKVAKWLNVEKKNLKRRLLSVDGLNKDVDYVITKVTRQGKWGGHKEEQIMMTSECFKILCMMSNTKKAHQVRMYYLEMEFLLDKYKAYIIKGQQKRIKQLENNQKPVGNYDSGVLYIIRAASRETNVYKLGRSTGLKNRLRQYNSGRADDVEVVFIYETDKINDIEKCVKMLAKNYQYRHYKEVYKVNLTILKKMFKKCDVFVNNKDMDKLRGMRGGHYMVIDKN